MSTQTEARQSQSRLRARIIPVVGAVLAAVIVWAASVPILGHTPVAQPNADTVMEITLPAVVVAALVGSLAGWVALAVVERFARRARAVWIVGAAVVLVASLAMPISAGDTTGDVVALALMHVAVAAVLIPGLSRTTR